MNKTVLITGSSSGFGKLTAKLFAEKGWNVIASMRSPEKETELNKIENIHVTKLDVTDSSSIKTAVSYIIERFGTIDVLVNNAGYGGHALFEQFSDETIRNMYETNVFGLMNATREVLPHMRKRKSGTIINITSIAGLVAAPIISIYASTKFAVEGFSEALAHELKPLNIKVKTVAPGSFGTNFTEACDNNFERGNEELKAFSYKTLEHMGRIRKLMRGQDGGDPDPQIVADIIYRCAIEETPVHNIAGVDAEKIIKMKNSMPQQDFLDKISSMVTPKN